jgi:hypothetical protein
MIESDQYVQSKKGYVFFLLNLSFGMIHEIER